MGQTKNLGLIDVDDCTEVLKDRAEVHPSIFGEFLGQLDLSWIYHENAVEGVVVTHAEMDSALKGRPIALDTYLAIRNLKLGINHMRQLASDSGAKDITLELIHGMHDVLAADESGNIEPGKYRKFIPLHRTYFHEIAKPDDIAAKMSDLVDWAIENRPEDEGAISYAAHFHHRFMRIFPFPKQSGKVGRLLMNYTLMRHGYLPVVIHGTERQRYYDTLRHTPKHMEDFLRTMMMNCIENATKFIELEVIDREKREFRRRIANAS